MGFFLLFWAQPKWGFLPTVERVAEVKKRNCRFCMHQIEKVNCSDKRSKLNLLTYDFFSILCVIFKYHHHHLEVHFLPRLLLLNGCFPTSQGRQTTFSDTSISRFLDDDDGDDDDDDIQKPKQILLFVTALTPYDRQPFKICWKYR